MLYFALPLKKDGNKKYKNYLDRKAGVSSL